MSHVRAALDLYLNAAKSALTGFPNTLLALAVLVVGAVSLVAVEMLFLEPMGANSLIAGICRSVGSALFVSTYLSLINMWVQAKRGTLFRHLRSHAGNLLWPFIYILFFFWMVEFVASFVPHSASWLLVVAAGIVVNPAPEIVYQERGEGFGTVQQAFEFMGKNWPEWLVMQLPFVALLAGWSVIAQYPLVPRTFGELWLNSGPRFELLNIASAYMSAGLQGRILPPLLGLLLLALAHGWMLFRGHVFRELSKGNRRLRAWQSRM
ncbi:MAG: hypothetical protein ACJAZO_001860 [Myxococcota bacterium]|jgi:hypothetical protein